MKPSEASPQRLAFILLVAVVLGFLPKLQAGEFSTGEMQTRFLAERGLSSNLPHVVKATAFIVDHDKKLPDGVVKFWRVLASEERSLSEAEIKRFLQIMENRRTYFPDTIKLCVPSYEIGVTLISRTSQTEVIFCLSCDMVDMHGDSESAGGHIDRGHNALLEFFRGVFPKNKGLKAISKREKEPKMTPEWAIEMGEDFIPNDPVLKQVKAMRREDQTEEVLEELMERAAASRYRK